MNCVPIAPTMMFLNRALYFSKLHFKFWNSSASRAYKRIRYQMSTDPILTHLITSFTKGVQKLIYELLWCSCVILSSKDLNGALDLWVPRELKIIRRGIHTETSHHSSRNKGPPLISSTTMDEGWEMTIAFTSSIFTISTANFPVSSSRQEK